MPELPEVETTARGIAPYVEGHRVSGVIIRQHQLRWPINEELGEILGQLTINSVSRRAKYLLFTTDNGTLILHLGMSGSLRVLSEPKEPTKHDHVDFLFDNGILLRFNDPRRFGAIIWTPLPAEKHSLLVNCGPEPLSSCFNENYLHQASINRKVPVKSFIMDSHVVVGVGNIYANEALFMAGIHPSRHAGTISLTRYKQLVQCIKSVLQEAIDQGGTTLRNFVNEAGKPGYFKQQLRVYGRKGEPCINCSSPLSEIRISNRSTVFCDHCQN